MIMVLYEARQITKGNIMDPRISIDYEELIQELSSDIMEGLFNLDDPVRYVRNEKGIIIDYYFKDDEIASDEVFHETTVKKPLREMVRDNSPLGYITLQEWAFINGISDSRARHKAIAGRIPAFKHGSIWYIDADAENVDHRYKKN